LKRGRTFHSHPLSPALTHTRTLCPLRSCQLSNMPPWIFVSVVRFLIIAIAA